MPSGVSLIHYGVVRWSVLIAFCACGLYTLSWAAQSASFSVMADRSMFEILKTKVLVLMPMSVLFPAAGLICFICLRRVPLEYEKSRARQDQ
jgi:hypothetical protein